MIRRILCFLFNHDWRNQEYAESMWWPHSTLHVCHRCGRVAWK